MKNVWACYTVLFMFHDAILVGWKSSSSRQWHIPFKRLLLRNMGQFNREDLTEWISITTAIDTVQVTYGLKLHVRCFSVRMDRENLEDRDCNNFCQQQGRWQIFVSKDTVITNPFFKLNSNSNLRSSTLYSYWKWHIVRCRPDSTVWKVSHSLTLNK